MRKKILIVDDNPSVILAVKTGLQDLASNYDFLEATSGLACLDLLYKGEQPDLILLDIMMPVMDGWEVQRKIQQNPEWKNIPIIFLTAKADPFSKKMGLIVSRDYITKPFDIVDVKKRIDMLLQTSN